MVRFEDKTRIRRSSGNMSVSIVDHITHYKLEKEKEWKQNQTTMLELKLYCEDGNQTLAIKKDENLVEKLEILVDMLEDTIKDIKQEI